MSTNTATPWCKSMEAKHFPFRKSGLTAAEDLWSIEINRMCCSSFAAENKQQPAEIPLSLIWCETGFLEEIIKVDSKNKINVGCTRISKIPTKYCWDHIKVLPLFSIRRKGRDWEDCNGCDAAKVVIILSGKLREWLSLSSISQSPRSKTLSIWPFQSQLQIFRNKGKRRIRSPECCGRRASVPLPSPKAKGIVGRTVMENHAWCFNNKKFSSSLSSTCKQNRNKITTERFYDPINRG